MGYVFTNSHDEGIGDNNGYIYGLEKHVLDLFEKHLGWFETEEKRKMFLAKKLMENNINEFRKY